jgi:methylthioribose-1-phosphate isomerase
MSSDESAARGEPPADPVSDADRPADPTRRQFFRAFGRQTVAGAGNVVGAAETLRRGGAAAASELLGLGFGSPAANAARMQASAESPPPSVEVGLRFSSPYAYADDAIVLLDQRRLPSERSTVACREASEVAAALRAGVINGGPILAEVAAHTLVLAVAGAGETSPDHRRRAFETAAETLLTARPPIRAGAWAVERMRIAHERVIDSEHATVVADMRREAEAIAMELALDHARLGRLGAPVLPKRTEGARPEERPLNLLFHGEMGPLSCGLVGTGFAVLRSLLDGGTELHVWLTEGGPRVRGGSLSSLQLAQLDIPHTVIPDAAASWLFENRSIAAALIRLDTIAAGQALGPIGATNVARLARAAGVPVLGCATTSSIEPADTPGTGYLPEMASPSDLPDATAQNRLEPITDSVPTHLLDAILTEEGPVEPPYDSALPRALEARAARRAAETVTGAAV